MGNVLLQWGAAVFFYWGTIWENASVVCICAVNGVQRNLLL